MKTSDLTINTVYAYQEHRTWGETKPAMVLDTKLWAIAERSVYTGKCFKTVCEIREADEGARARKGDYRKGPIGIPVIVLDEGDWRWTSDAKDTQIADTAYELLELAAAEIDFASLKGQYNGLVTSRPKVDVVARLVGGGTMKVTARVEFFSPQTLVGLWTPHLLKIEAGRVAKVEYLAKEKAKAAEELGETAAIMRRLDALVGANPYVSPYEVDPGDNRRDIRRHQSYVGDFEISKELLLALLDKAENSQA